MAKIWISRNGGEPKEIDEVEFNNSALPLKGWTVTSAPIVPTEAEVATKKTNEDKASFKDEYIALYNEIQNLKSLQASSDKLWDLTNKITNLTDKLNNMKTVWNNRFK